MSEQVRGQVDDQHVHHSRQQRVTGKRRPALDQHLVDTAGTQCPQQTRQIDAPAKLRQAQHIGTGGAQFRFCLARCGLAAHDQSLTRQAEHAGTRWRAQPGIEHHTQRLAQIVDGLDAGQLPGLQANVHRGIIRQHAADPGDHGAAAGTQPLHVKARIGTEIEVLVDGVSDEHEFLLEGRWWGQAPEVDGKIYLANGDAAPGEIRKALVTAAADYDLVADLLTPEGEIIRRYEVSSDKGWTRAAFCVDQDFFFLSNFLDGVLERRSVEELEELLKERLDIIKTRRRGS